MCARVITSGAERSPAWCWWPADLDATASRGRRLGGRAAWFGCSTREGPMSVCCSFDVAGRRRSPATTAEFHLGRAPGNKGMSYPADPPRVEEIVAVMRQAGGGLHGDRMRGLIVVLWRAGLRISEALDLREGDLEPGRGALLVREGKGGRRREVGMDDWGWDQLRAGQRHQGPARWCGPRGAQGWRPVVRVISFGGSSAVG